MTTTPYFIAGDWGTSNLRLYLCEYSDEGGHQAGSTLIETRHGPGVSDIKDDFEDKFFMLAQDWFDKYGPMPVILSGMIGSTIGWKDAPYLSCPVTPQKIANGRLSFTARGIDFSILAGLKTVNPLGAPDVMRGEELQLLGWTQMRQTHKGQQLFALPGTHNKWSLMHDGEISNFLTAFTGELFSLIRHDSILISDDSGMAMQPEAFMQGVATIENNNEAHLVHTLFSIRSKQVLGEMASSDSLSYLAGMIAAADIIGALNVFPNIDGVTVIGENVLSEQYLKVLSHLGVDAESCAPADIALAGFNTIYQTIYR